VQPSNPNFPDAPVLILAPTGNDARNAADVLGRAAINGRVCSSIHELCELAGDQTGSMVIGEEVFDMEALQCLFDYLTRQPPWSDIPVLLITRPGEIKQKTQNILNFLGTRTNMTLVEKPLRAVTLVSVVQSSLRSRSRQFEVRDLLNDYAKSVEDEQKANAKFRALFEQSSIFAGIMTLDGRMLEANRLWLETCGYKAEEILGRPLWECGWWSAFPEAQKKLREGTTQAARGIPYVENLPYVWSDNSEHVMEFGLYPIRDTGGLVIFLHPTGTDITERKKAFARSEFLSQLTQKLSTVSDPQELNRTATREIGQFLNVDRCYFVQESILGEEVKVLPDWRRKARRGMEGKYKVASFGPPEWWKKVETGPVSVDDTRTDKFTREHVSSYEEINVRAYVVVPFIHEGRWVASICVTTEEPRRWTDGEKSLLENALARAWPLIERANVERSLREANSLLADKAAHLEALVQQRTVKLKDTIADLEAFSYSIAHDMRAPLRSLHSFSEILLAEYSQKLDEEPRHLLHRIANAAGRMDKLIQDVLNYSRVVRSEFPLATVDIEQLLRDIVSTYPAFAPDKADIFIEGPFPPVLGNEAMLTQIFSNLMGNAVKFVRPGGRPDIRIWAEASGRRARIFVQDHGIGIAADQHEKIFGIFQQASKSYEGTGIGLAIVKKAIERIGGRIGLWSEPDRGSTFWIDAQMAEVPRTLENEPETTAIR
jgi:PAS domain S-box-containing protein